LYDGSEEAVAWLGVAVDARIDDGVVALAFMRGTVNQL
jgi:hypothetical protein